MTTGQTLRLRAALIDRINGLPYHHAIEKYHITGYEFYRAAQREQIGSILNQVNGKARERLEQMVANKAKRAELFRMEESFLHTQLDNILAGTQTSIVRGTGDHPENLEDMVYYALTKAHPELKSRDPARVVKGLRGLKRKYSNLRRHFRDIGIRFKAGGANENESSPVYHLLAFDRAFVRKYSTKKKHRPSLFDLNQPEHKHLHVWDFRLPVGYFDEEGIEDAIYHTLAAWYRKLGSKNRKTVLQALEKLRTFPAKLTKTLVKFNINGKRHESPLEWVFAYDRAYQRRFKDAGLFDLDEPLHAHWWELGFTKKLQLHRYRKDAESMERAIYHAMVEDNPVLASTDRDEVIAGMRALSPLQKYFERISLRSLVHRSKWDPAEETVRAFDRVWQSETGNRSLFDQAFDDYLEFYGKKNRRLVKKKAAA